MKTMQRLDTEFDLNEAVLFQLEKILRHRLFLTSPVLSRFLNYIVEETLAGKQDYLKEYTIAVHVLHKPVNFVPAYDAIVRVHARRLRKALITYYEQNWFNDNCIISIPKGRYVPLFEHYDDQRPSGIYARVIPMRS